MPLSRSRDYLSIGEVLENLRSDFPDVTISKIRFLEAEGLIDPERTQSGYRKFYDDDVKRLRYVLQLQRDHFMPLKVIRTKLAEFGDGAGSVAPAPTPAEPELEASPTLGSSSAALSRAELQQEAGLSDDELDGLCDFGLLPAQEPYDEDHLVAAKAARGLFKFGVEPRHLRMYRQFAEREGAFFEQIVSPVARRQDPEAQEEAARSIRELAGLSRQFREAVLRSNLRSLL